MMQKHDLHLIILWENGLEQLPSLLDELKSIGEIVDIKPKKWPKKLFQENLTRFYAHSLKHKPPSEITTIINEKCTDCGTGAFKVVIFKDNNPKYEYRNTSGGNDQYVNSRVFDIKYKFRIKLNAPIHSTNDPTEFIRDFTLLFHIHPEKYLSNQYLIGSNNESENILGVPQWNSIHELFLALNVSAEYVVIRNFECLPDKYHVENHGDIDLLVDNLNHVVQLTGAKSLYPDLSYRVHYSICINGEEVPFDFRNVNDNYYDIQWSRNILKDRILVRDCFYAPNDRDYYFSLLYHALIHKPSLSNDYVDRLNNLAQTISLDSISSGSIHEASQALFSFLKEKGYLLVVPKDLTVYFNQHLIKKGDQELVDKEKSLLSVKTVRTLEDAYTTEVYRVKEGIMKIATNPIATNEKNALLAFSTNNHFPNVLNFKVIDENTSSILMEEIIGLRLIDIRHEKKFWTSDNVKKTLTESIDILIKLSDSNITHRDIKPDNLYLRNNSEGSFELVLIDFGWCEFRGDKNVITPALLGGDYRPPKGPFSDAYSLALSLESCGFSHFPFCKEVLDNLMTMEPSQKDERQQLEEIKSKIKNFSFIDHIRLWFNRHYSLMKADRYYKFLVFLKRTIFWNAKLSK